jgi:23S rRNA pseudouridine955/2504/2580 synthase
MMIRVLFEDEYLIAAEKPSGIPTQQTVDKKRPDFFSQLKNEISLREASLTYLGLHHRLDVGTSGIILFSKVKFANKHIAKLFNERKIKKTYLAITDVQECPNNWEVKNYLAEYKDHKDKKMKMRSVKSGGLPAHTLFKKIEALKRGLLIQAEPQTGRMHQIRVHLAEAKMGIFGDDLYPHPNAPLAPRLMLHALKLEFNHPFSHRPISIECPPPPEMLDFKSRLC